MPPLLHLSVYLLRRQKLRQQKDHRGQEAFSGIIEKCVLSAAGAISIWTDDRLGKYFRIFLRLCFCRYVFGIFHRNIHVLIDQGEKIVTIRPHGIPQINHRHLIPIAFRSNVSIVPREVALRIQGQEAHPAGAGVLQIGVQEKGRLTNAAGTNHQAMNIITVDQRRHFALFPR